LFLFSTDGHPNAPRIDSPTKQWQNKISSNFERLFCFANEIDKRRRSTEAAAAASSSPRAVTSTTTLNLSSKCGNSNSPHSTVTSTNVSINHRSNTDQIEERPKTPSGTTDCTTSPDSGIEKDVAQNSDPFKDGESSKNGRPSNSNNTGSSTVSSSSARDRLPRPSSHSSLGHPYLNPGSVHSQGLPRTPSPSHHEMDVDEFHVNDDSFEPPVRIPTPGAGVCVQNGKIKIEKGETRRPSGNERGTPFDEEQRPLTPKGMPENDNSCKNQSSKNNHHEYPTEHKSTMEGMKIKVERMESSQCTVSSSSTTFHHPVSLGMNFGNRGAIITPVVSSAPSSMHCSESSDARGNSSIRSSVVISTPASCVTNSSCAALDQQPHFKKKWNHFGHTQQQQRLQTQSPHSSDGRSSSVASDGGMKTPNPPGAPNECPSPAATPPSGGSNNPNTPICKFWPKGKSHDWVDRSSPFSKTPSPVITTATVVTTSSGCTLNAELNEPTTKVVHVTTSKPCFNNNNATITPVSTVKQNNFPSQPVYKSTVDKIIEDSLAAGSGSGSSNHNSCSFSTSSHDGSSKMVSMKEVNPVHGKPTSGHNNNMMIGKTGAPPGNYNMSGNPSQKPGMTGFHGQLSNNAPHGRHFYPQAQIFNAPGGGGNNGNPNSHSNGSSGSIRSSTSNSNINSINSSSNESGLYNVHHSSSNAGGPHGANYHAHGPSTTGIPNGNGKIHIHHSGGPTMYSGSNPSAPVYYNNGGSNKNIGTAPPMQMQKGRYAENSGAVHGHNNHVQSTGGSTNPRNFVPNGYHHHNLHQQQQQRAPPIPYGNNTPNGYGPPPGGKMAVESGYHGGHHGNHNSLQHASPQASHGGGGYHQAPVNYVHGRSHHGYHVQHGGAPTAPPVPPAGAPSGGYHNQMLPNRR